jgi:hypothetical protein
MSDLTARELRASNRRRRRGDGDGDGDGDEAKDGDATPHLQDTLKAAASAAAVGAAVGAARAYSSRRQDAETEDVRTEEVAQPEVQEEDAPAPAHAHEPETEPAREEEPHYVTASRDDFRQIVSEARRLLHDLHGKDAESVSSVSQTAGAWTVGLEVLEVKRIPDSTDVLATYEVELDGDGGVRRFERVRRYHRSEADRGGRS